MFRPNFLCDVMRNAMEEALHNISLKPRNESSFIKTKLRTKWKISAGRTHPKNDFGVGLEID